MLNPPGAHLPAVSSPTGTGVGLRRLASGPGRRRRPRLAGVGGDGRCRAPGGGGEVEHAAASPERRETVAGECLGCQTQLAIDLRLPLPAVCPDCGADVFASADIKGEALPRLPFDPLRIRRAER